MLHYLPESLATQLMPPLLIPTISSAGTTAAAAFLKPSLLFLLAIPPGGGGGGVNDDDAAADLVVTRSPPDNNNSNMMLSLLMRGLAKNINLYWILATGLAVWFLFLHTPVFWTQRRLISRDVLLAVHIVAAAGVYLACVHNSLVTPSVLLPQSLDRRSIISAKWMHRWMGRMGLVSGLISFALGTLLAWSRLGVTSHPGSTSLSFAIPITIGGLLQLQCEYRGFRSIRQYKALEHQILRQTTLQQGDVVGQKRERTRNQSSRLSIEDLRNNQKQALGTHIGYMVSLFVSACGIPAGIRLAELLSRGDEGLLGTAALVAVIGMLQYNSARYVRKLVAPLSRH